MKIKAIIAAIAVAVVALFASSCNKSDSGSSAGAYYVSFTTDVEDSGDGPNTTAIFAFRAALDEAGVSTSGSIVYKNAVNDQKAIAACDKVYELHKNTMTATIQLYFQNAVGEGEKPTQTVIKTYAPYK